MRRRTWKLEIGQASRPAMPFADNHWTLSQLRIDDAPPPPLQIDATPFSPALSACTKCITIRAPDML
ncbi:hypothetical protein ALC60_06254 [Trachymyrmex zeteki]|uniref:Uncharacterized protein n=1 Tax=Mycetomoellerius zeteki TaxID=64791 RepID=A0A151X3C7_9HYME|nr:hypothetical protein ALC60_06254 [Trachymyrmex zeteki]